MNKDDRVLVTGPSSMIGRQVLSLLKEKGYTDVIPLYHEQCDLTDKQKTLDTIESYGPEYVIHLGGFNGGIEFNKNKPNVIFERTAYMAMNVLTACANNPHLKKVVSVITSCSYPGDIPRETKEEELWNGPVHPSVDCHGHSKRILDAYSSQLRKTGVNAVCCIVNNSYGPFDKFERQRSKVVGGLIRRFVEAKDNNEEEIVCWGTGAPVRQFLYCRDAAEGIIQSMETDIGDRINLSTDENTTIKELVEAVSEVVGYEGKIVWDTDKQDGQMIKKLDITKMKNLLDVKLTPLKEGLKETVEWYIENKDWAS